jgi:hypothetical protein
MTCRASCKNAAARSRRLLGALLVALGAGGCPGTIDPSLWPSSSGSGGAGSVGAGGSGGAGMQVCDPTPIFDAKICANGACHDATDPSADFDMASGGWQTHLVGVNPTGGGITPSSCPNNGPYLVAGALPARGLFLEKLNPDLAPPCGVVMPLVGAKLTAAEFACVQSWANALVMAGPAATGAGGASGGGGAGGSTATATAGGDR